MHCSSLDTALTDEVTMIHVVFTAIKLLPYYISPFVDCSLALLSFVMPHIVMKN